MFTNYNYKQIKILTIEDEENLKILRERIEEFEKKEIIMEINKSSGNISNAAKSLGITRSWLYTKMEKLGIKKYRDYHS